MSKPPRVWVSQTTARKGDLLRVRAQVEHAMESGLRTNAQGQRLPRNIIKRFEARWGTASLMVWEPGVSVSQNPYLEFTFVARESGELQLQWLDDGGQTLRASKAIVVS